MKPLSIAAVALAIQVGCRPSTRPCPNSCPKCPDAAKIEIRVMADLKAHQEAQAAGWKRPPPGFVFLANPARSGPLDSPMGFEKVVVEERAFLNACDMRGAATSPNPGGPGKWQIDLEFYREGSGRLAEATGRLYKSQPQGHMAVLLLGTVTSCPRVTAKIETGSASITGDFSESSAKYVVETILAGCPCARK